MRNRRSLLAFVWVLGLVAAFPAAAREGEPEVVVANRMFDMGGKFEVAFSPLTVSVFDKYTRHFGLDLGLVYYFHDTIGIEIEGGYNYVAGWRVLLTDIVAKSALQAPVEKLPLTDLKYMQGYAQGGLIFSPLYGKLNLSSELAFGINLYFVAGGGVGFYKYPLRGIGTGGHLENQLYASDMSIKGMFYFGGGVRLHALDWFSLRLEVRDQCAPDSYVADKKTVSNAIEPVTIEDFVHIVSFRLVTSFAF
ncbi:MAG TPA: outer membrane beta-barrel domain-containing protein [Myxococcota bacterium]|nr:outer membrane beta-barrel domain-containing protein [Myxococcota bacterium]HRY94112.1 outer membrane beta-barrel domain-containing protein [Myxococcota bacterium]HSA23259.1 outer membrane beta-barrel domain-containing protein [Myxococcota bacterium]